MTSGVAVVIPSIPVRSQLLARAVHSASAQTVKPDAYSIAIDNDKLGAGPTRTRALMAVHAADTPWVAFLDDDDEWMAGHLVTLLDAAADSGADVVWPWFKVVGGTDPIEENRGKQWDSDHPFTFPITALVRTELAQECYFPEPIPGAENSGEDWAFWMQMDRLSAKFHHVNEITWWWHHDSGNTSGRPERW